MEIRALVLGDRKVGKTSIINSLTSDQPADSLPHIHNPIKIPNDQCIEDSSVTIIDSYSERPFKLEKTTKAELKKANIILLVYDISQASTIQNLSKFWLPYITKHSKSPIIVIGNKIDLKPSIKNYSLEHIITTLTQQDYIVDYIIECSAKTLQNLDDVFLHTQNAVIYPISPIYDTKTEKISQQFLKALKMVFRRFDKDRDFHLSSKELIDMQAEVFQTRMDENDIQSLIDLIARHLSSGVSNNKVNFEGFCHLQVLMIQQLQNEVCWKLLKHYGFDYNLNLNVDTGFLATVKRQNIALSKTAISFLLSLFDQYSNDGLLTSESTQEIFDSCSLTNFGKDKHKLWNDFKERVELHNGCLNCASWLSLWHLLVYLDYHSSLILLIMSGCDLRAEEIFVAVEQDNKNLLVVYLIGINQVGKSWILNGFINNFQENYMPTSSLKYCCNIIEESSVPWNSKYTIMVEYPVIDVDKMIKDIQFADKVVVVVNENKESVEFLKDINLKEYCKYEIIDNSYRKVKRDELVKVIFNTLWCKSVEFTESIASKSEVVEVRDSNYKIWVIALLVLIIGIIFKSFIR